MKPDAILSANVAVQSILRDACPSAVPRELSESHKQVASMDVLESYNAYDHLAYMTTQIPGFVQQGRLDKAQRWLCFVQGVLWAHGHASIDQLKNANRKLD